MIGKQQKGSYIEIITYSNGKFICPRDQQKSSISFNIQSRISEIFLPIGYPYSVKPEYLTYQIYDSIQALCSYLRGVLCTHALLMAAGVGTTEASAMSAAITWIIKDGIGMFYSIFFISTFSTYFGAYLKEWRLFADLINDVALTIDLISPYFPRSLHVYILSFSAICKTMCGISASSTKLCITNHLCLQSNEADVNAKEGSQETAICLIGLILGMTMSHFASSNSHLFFFLLTSLHVYCNYYAVKCLQLQSINRTRGYLLYTASFQEDISAYLLSRSNDVVSSYVSKYHSRSPGNASPLSVFTINSLESLLLSLRLSFSASSPIPNVFIGVPLLDALNCLNTKVFDGQTPSQICELIQNYSASTTYCIIPRSAGGYNVILRNGCTLLNQYEAFCRCLYLDRKFHTSHLSFHQIYLDTTEEFERYWENFTLLLQYEKWDLDHSISMDCYNWTYEWNSTPDMMKKHD